MLAAPLEELQARAQLLSQQFHAAGLGAEVVKTEDQVGGGSAPLILLESRAVALSPAEISVSELESRMRRRVLPIIGRISQNRYLLDVRTLQDADFPRIVEAAVEILK